MFTRGFSQSLNFRRLFGIDADNDNSGFTLVEVIVTVAIFAILLTGVLSAYNALAQTTKAAREKTILASLATNYLEIVRNMPYSQVGTTHGNPNGTLADCGGTPPSCPYAIVQKIGAYSYEIYYEVTYIDDPADGLITGGGANYDSAPDDYKQVKMSILNTTTNQVNSFVTNVVPLGLEGITNAGALLIKVIDAQGQPISGADIKITYPTTTPTLILDRQSDATGQWIEVGLPAAVNNYRVVVSKSGYSSDQTYPVTGANPNPTKPDATILNGIVTQITFSIDKLSTLNIKTLDEFCHALSGVNLNVSGAKLIGTPAVYKFNQNFSSVSGLISLNNLEWDSYTPTLLTGQSVIVKGTSPVQTIDVLPGTSQTFTMILTSNTTSNSLLVIVKDSATGTALENATVHLQKGGSTPLDYYGVTGGSVWVQSDWSGGAGQVNWSSSTPNQYYQDNGHVDSNSAPTGLKLQKISGKYPNPGWVESSTFDTGTSATNYTIISWLPASQTASTTVQFQVAGNNDNITWNYVGPDGTAATYFTTPGTDIGSIIDNNRYVRYKVYLSTTDVSKSPVLSSANLNFVTGCFTPGQYLFTGLTSGNNYNLDVSIPGYTTFSVSSLNISGNQTQNVLMSP